MGWDPRAEQDIEDIHRALAEKNKVTDHTPGPWTPMGLDDGTWIIGRGPNFVPPFAWATEEADARLIAAAPDLLAALERIATEGHEPERLGFQAKAIARAAIAKAKGGVKTP